MTALFAFVWCAECLWSWVRRETGRAVCRDFVNEYIVNQLWMRRDSVIRHECDHVFGDRGINPAGHQIEPENSRRSIPTRDTVNVHVAAGIAHTFMDCLHACNCVAGRNSYQVLNRTPNDSLEWAVGFRQLVRRFADVDNVGDRVSLQFIEPLMGRESTLPDVASDAEQRKDPLLRVENLSRRTNCDLCGGRLADAKIVRCTFPPR